MPQAVWTGAIAFGLVNVPVKLYPATEPKDVRFHLYDQGTGKRVRLERVARWWETPSFKTPEPASGVAERERKTGSVAPSADPDDDIGESPSDLVVSTEDIVRGYEDAEGQIVALTPQEIAAITPSRSRSIEVEDFVELDRVDPVFFDKSYYVAPVRGVGAEKPYSLLLRAMEAAGKVGIGRFVLRTKPHLVAIRPMDGILALETLFFGDEVRDTEELSYGLAGVVVAERELEIAQELISALAVPWDPNRYSDNYREGLLEMIRSKTPMAPGVSDDVSLPRVSELMEALKASVEAAKGRKLSPRGRQSKRAI